MSTAITTLSLLYLLPYILAIAAIIAGVYLIFRGGR
jgi:hypothetical protein